jgi:membrane protein DedA with SNARE-associated domain/rhodanese-related sulfurtransferase
LIQISPAAIATWGAAAVFLNVLVTRLGAPLPVIPILLFAGSAIAHGTLLFSHILLAAVVAALIGDCFWFAAGRAYGHRLINVLAQISMTVGTGVRRARALFERYGVPIVAVSKFVPGLALITPPLMGTTPVEPAVFVAWDTAGTVAWASFWLLGGALFERQLGMLLMALRPYGATIADVLAALAVLYVAYRYLGRWRFRRWLAHVNVSAEDLDAMLRSQAPPVVLDARWPATRNRERYRIPGAVLLDLNSLDSVFAALVAREVVVYCDCPNDATAKKVCEQLHSQGFPLAHALQGGLDAWVRRGLPVEPLPLPAKIQTGALRGA